MSAIENHGGLKDVKEVGDWARKQYKNHYVYYRRKGNYAQCMCSECGKRYVIRAIGTEDPFEDAFLNVEKPARDVETECRKCGIKAIFKPAGKTAAETHYNYICYGQKIDDDHFVFRIFYSLQKIRSDKRTHYEVCEDKRIFLEKGKKPKRYTNNGIYWYESFTGEQWHYIVHPRTFANIKRTGMIKYVPEEKRITERFYEQSWVIDYYIAAARYPDFEMFIKMGLTEFATRLVHKYSTNINPRGKKIEDRLRIYKTRIPYMIRTEGDSKSTELFQLERRLKKHWTDEDLETIEYIRDHMWSDRWKKLIRYSTPKKIRNYMMKQKMWPNETDTYAESRDKTDLLQEYIDYLIMREEEGYDMTNSIILFPKDLRRRHDEMVIEREKQAQDKRNKEVTKRFPKIKARYEELSEKYSAAASGYIIRPAKNAVEIVTEGRVLHHCVGGDWYLAGHNQGKSFILFLRPAEKKDEPYITVEIEGNEIKQWYGAYDKKPNRKFFDGWLKTYCKELEKREKETEKKKPQKRQKKTA